MALRVPKAFAAETALESGSAVELTLDGGRLVVTPVASSSYDLDHLLAHVTPLAIFCPITSQVKGYPFEVALASSGTIGGVLLADQVKSLDWREWNMEFVDSGPAELVEDVLGKLATLVMPS